MSLLFPISSSHCLVPFPLASSVCSSGPWLSLLGQRSGLKFFLGQSTVSHAVPCMVMSALIASLGMLSWSETCLSWLKSQHRFEVALSRKWVWADLEWGIVLNTTNDNANNVSSRGRRLDSAFPLWSPFHLWPWRDSCLVSCAPACGCSVLISALFSKECWSLTCLFALFASLFLSHPSPFLSALPNLCSSWGHIQYSFRSQR